MYQYTETAKRVLAQRYLLKDGAGNPTETVDDMYLRVCKAVAAAEANYCPKSKAAATKDTYTKAFHQLLSSCTFLPNTPTLINAGRPLGQLSACFVLPVEDDMRSIFDTVTNTALIHQSGGGTGFSFSRIRPKGSRVSTTGGQASGPLSFMAVYNTATDCVKQGGARRGANMGCLRVDHPDILEFITCKQDPTKFTNFNLSVVFTDDFFEALKGREWQPPKGFDPTQVAVHAPEKEDMQRHLFALKHAGKVYSWVDARHIMDKIVECAWATGEPGGLFIDEINRYNPVRKTELIESCNPCGEQPLLPYESCNLGSINLMQCLTLPEEPYQRPSLDTQKFKNVVTLAVRFLDNVIDINKYPIPEIATKTKMYRKIGLNIMGFADMLFAMGIPYDSEEAQRWGYEIARALTQCATEASQLLATERGAFPEYSAIAAELESTLGINWPVRNALTTTIAPTGTLSIIAGVSSGIEPLFAPVLRRHILDSEDFLEIDPVFERELTRQVANAVYKDRYCRTTAAEIMHYEWKDTGEKHDLSDRGREVVKEALLYAEQHGSVKGFTFTGVGGNQIPLPEIDILQTAKDISVLGHIGMQAAFQTRIQSGISKTINMPNEATKEMVLEAFMSAQDLHCKGITVYRDGCRANQVLNTIASPVKKVEEPTPVVQTTEEPIAHPGFLQARAREKQLNGTTTCMRTGCGKLYVTINSDKFGVVEIFTTTGKSGGCASQSEAAARLASVGLRAGIDPTEIISQLKNIRCPSAIRHPGSECTSCPDAIAQCLKDHLNITPCVPAPRKGVPAPVSTISGTDVARPKCEQCGETMIRESGCQICHSCGNSHCL